MPSNDENAVLSQAGQEGDESASETSRVQGARFRDISSSSDEPQADTRGHRFRFTVSDPEVEETEIAPSNVSEPAYPASEPEPVSMEEPEEADEDVQPSESYAADKVGEVDELIEPAPFPEVKPDLSVRSWPDVDRRDGDRREGNDRRKLERRARKNHEPQEGQPLLPESRESLDETNETPAPAVFDWPYSADDNSAEDNLVGEDVARHDADSAESSIPEAGTHPDDLPVEMPTWFDQDPFAPLQDLPWPLDASEDAPGQSEYSEGSDEDVFGGLPYPAQDEELIDGTRDSVENESDWPKATPASELTDFDALFPSTWASSVESENQRLSMPAFEEHEQTEPLAQSSVDESAANGQTDDPWANWPYVDPHDEGLPDAQDVQNAVNDWFDPEGANAAEPEPFRPSEPNLSASNVSETGPYDANSWGQQENPWEQTANPWDSPTNPWDDQGVNPPQPPMQQPPATGPHDGARSLAGLNDPSDPWWLQGDETHHAEAPVESWGDEWSGAGTDEWSDTSDPWAQQTGGMGHSPQPPHEQQNPPQQYMPPRGHQQQPPHSYEYDEGDPWAQNVAPGHQAPTRDEWGNDGWGEDPWASSAAGAGEDAWGVDSGVGSGDYYGNQHRQPADFFDEDVAPGQVDEDGWGFPGEDPYGRQTPRQQYREPEPVGAQRRQRPERYGPGGGRPAPRGRNGASGSFQLPPFLKNFIEGRSKLTLIVIVVVVVLLLSVVVKDLFSKVGAEPLPNGGSQTATCATSPTDSHTPTAAALQASMVAVPNGWTVVPDYQASTGAVDFSQALRDEPEAAKALAILDSSRFQLGFDRSFTRSNGVSATVAIYQFASSVCASQFVSSHAGSAATSFNVPSIPAAQGLVSQGSTNHYVIRAAKGDKAMIVSWSSAGSVADAVSGVIDLATAQWSTLPKA